MSVETDLESVAALAGLMDATVVEGIPVLHAPHEGQVTGGLFFRVGRGDETLATAGVTHLVEHLALLRQNLSDVHHNGQTSDTYTLFHATGGADEVVAFLNGVCAALRDLPLARLGVEKEILRTEAARRTSRAFEAMGMWRYGAQGPGLPFYDEEGLGRLTAADVAEWVATRFTRDNAALFLTHDSVPDGLDLALPAGHRFPVVLPPDGLPMKPAWFRGAGGGAIVDAVLPRSPEAVLFARVASRVLFRELRQEGGLSYQAGCDYDHVDRDQARIVAHADALPEKQDAVVGGLVDALAALRAGRIDPADLAAAHKQARQEMDVPELGTAMLPAAALALLTGTPMKHPDQTNAERDAVTVDDLTRVAGEFWDGALAQVPAAGLDWAGFTAAPSVSDAEVEGLVYPHVSEEGVALVLAADGVSLRTPHGPVTVRYADCALASAYPDGGRVLVGRDGFRLAVEPTLYQWLTPEVVGTRIDPHVPAAVTLTLPARALEDIPQPQPVVAPAHGPRFRVLPRWRGLPEWVRTLGIFLICLAVVLTLAPFADTMSLLTGAAASVSPRTLTAEWVAAALTWFFGVTFVLGAARRRAVGK